MTGRDNHLIFESYRDRQMAWNIPDDEYKTMRRGFAVHRREELELTRFVRNDPIGDKTKHFLALNLARTYKEHLHLHRNSDGTYNVIPGPARHTEWGDAREHYQRQYQAAMDNEDFDAAEKFRKLADKYDEADAAVGLAHSSIVKFVKKYVDDYNSTVK